MFRADRCQDARHDGRRDEGVRLGELRPVCDRNPQTYVEAIAWAEPGDFLILLLHTQRKAAKLVLGLPLCWVVLLIGFGDKTSIITSPLITLEVSQAGFGMYVKYLLAAQLGVFAASMTIQFASYFLEGIADYRGDPGGRAAPAVVVH